MARFRSPADWHRVEHDIFAEDFLLPRPLLAAIRATEPVVLLIDEVNRHFSTSPRTSPSARLGIDVYRTKLHPDLITIDIGTEGRLPWE